MNEFKFQLTTFLLVALLAFAGYWAFTTLDRGITYQNQEQVDVPGPSDDLPDNPVVIVNPDINSDEGDNDEDSEETDESDDNDTNDDQVEDVTEQDNSNSTELSADEEDLRRRLQNLINDDIFMRQGSRGTRVGTVQEFLNTYLDEPSTVDNEYGPGTLRRVREFQEAEGLSADGLAGPDTYRKMIEVLES